MDFKVTAGETTLITDQFHHMLTFIKEQSAQWNNYDPSQPLHITIEKVPSQTDTLGVDVGDVLDIAEMLS